MILEQPSEGKTENHERSITECIAKVKKRKKVKLNRKREEEHAQEENPLSFSQISEDVVNEMNRRFAILEQPSFLILEEEDDGNFSLDKKGSFRDRFQNQKIALEKGIQKSKADIFLESPLRRTFLKIVMNPRKEGHYLDEITRVRYFNLWRGFAVEPQEGSCDKFKRHVLEVVCSGKQDHYEFLMSLLAHWVQKPEARTVAVLLRGSQGCGKTFFAETIGSLFGRAYGAYDDVERLLGRFNADQAYKLLIFADEALWGGQKCNSGKLKAAITSEKFWIEGKGKDKIPIENHRKFIAASNERFALPLDNDDRRWLVLDCSSHRANDRRYFNEVSEELKDGGYRALLYELLHRDISSFDPHLLPENDDAFDMKLKSSSSLVRYIFSALIDANFDLANDSYAWLEQDKIFIRCDLLREHYLAFCKREQISLESDETCGVLLKAIFDKNQSGFRKAEKRFEGKKKRVYIFPGLSKSQELLAAYFKLSSADKIFPKIQEVTEV